MTRISHVRVRLLLTAGLALSLTSASMAQTLTWNNAAGGAAATAANWNPAQVPSAASPLLFSLNAAYPVTFSAAVPSSSSFSFTRGTVTLTMTSPHSTGSVSLGTANTNNGIATLATGTWNAATVSLGTAFGSAGTLNVNDDDALLDCGSLLVAANTNLVCNVNVTGAGRITPSSLSIGVSNPIGTGNVTVSGQAQILPPLRSTIDASSTITVGQDGVGTLTVSNGGLVATASNMIVAQNVSAGPIFSDGTVTVGGLGIILPATINVGGSLRIGRGSLSSSDTGHGAVIVDDDGVVTVGGVTQVGGSGLGSGLLQVNTGARFTSRGLVFGASGDFQHRGGTVTVTSGTFTHDEDTLIISGTAPGPSLVLDALTNTPTYSAVGAHALLIGDNGAGALSLTNGTDMSITEGNITIGDTAGSSGSLSIESGSSFFGSDSTVFVVGREGDGVLNVRGGSQLTVDGVFVSLGAGAGSVLAENPGTHVSSSAINAFSGSSVVVRDGALLTTDGAFGNQVFIQPQSSLTLDHATIEATTGIDIDGAFTMTAGVIHAARFEFSVPISASGVIDARIIGSSPITATGDLSLGNNATNAITDAPINVGAFRVDTFDSNNSILANTTINGGLLTASDAFVLPASRTLSGTGTIASDFSNAGSITATGANGLTFGGIIDGFGQGIGGTKFTFTSGGGFRGFGTINSKIAGLAGSSIVITGGVASLGDGSAAGFFTDGELDLTRDLTILDSNGIGLGSLTTLRGTTLTCGSGVSLGSAPTLDTLAGAGTIAANLSNAGVISPGFPGLDATGQISILGAYTQSSGATLGALNIEISGTAPGEFDRIIATSAVLNGTLNVTLINGFVPTPGASWPVAGASTLSGQFAVTNLPPGFRVEYSVITADIVYCPADFNGDGATNSQDFFDFLNAFFNSTPAADFNGDAANNSQDFFDFLSAFFGPAC